MKNRRTRLRPAHDRVWTGLILIIIGSALFVQKSGIDWFPAWVFTWPMILILIGLVTGIRHRFSNISWLIMTGIGAFFLADQFVDYLDVKRYMWPIIITAAGLLFLCRRKQRFRKHDELPDTDYADIVINKPEVSEDMIESISILGGVKRVVTSKAFKGGEIVCVMGGAEINFSQADVNGVVIIDITQVLGGIKLIIPPHWEVRFESISIFAGFEDKRPVLASGFDPNKVIIIRGTTIFGGIEIKSY